MGKVILRTSELAKCLGVSEATVRKWARAGIVPAIRPTRRTLRFDLDAVALALAGGPSTRPPVAERKGGGA